MTIEEWLDHRIEETGIGTQTELARRAGISPATISIGKKRGSFSKKTMKKLESYLGEYNPEEELPEVITDEEFFRKVETTVEESVSRFNGSSCATSSKLCRTCWETLKSTDKKTPETRAMCRLSHGWTRNGGVLFFKEEDGTLVKEEDL